MGSHYSIGPEPPSSSRIPRQSKKLKYKETLKNNKLKYKETLQNNRFGRGISNFNPSPRDEIHLGIYSSKSHSTEKLEVRGPTAIYI